MKNKYGNLKGDEIILEGSGFYKSNLRNRWKSESGDLNIGGR